MFFLIVDDFGIEYVGDRHAHHLRDTLLEHYSITQDWIGSLYSGINIAWDYDKRTCCLTMVEYIVTILSKCHHGTPIKRVPTPYKHTKITYGTKVQYANTTPTSPPLDDAGIKRVQSIVGALLFYAQAIDNELLVALGEIGSQQVAPTKDTAAAIDQLLNYVAIYPNDGVTYQSSSMIFAAHANAGYLNISKACSCAGAHIMLSEDDPVPGFNGPVLTIAQIIKFVMSSAAKAKLADLFICAKAMVPMRQLLIEIGCPQPKSPIQTDSSTAAGVINKTIIAKNIKFMDMQLWWLCCHESQGRFRFYWASGNINSTKYHLPLYHEAHHPTHAGKTRSLDHFKGVLRPSFP